MGAWPGREARPVIRDSTVAADMKTGGNAALATTMMVAAGAAFPPH